MSEDISITEVDDRKLTSGEITRMLEILSDAFKYELDPNKEIYEIRNYIFHMNRNGSHIYVMKLNGEIIGLATLLVDRKLIHNLSLVGHIEDVAIHKDYRGFGYGKRLIEHLKAEAKFKDCYKTVLYCADYNKKFYQKCGFRFVSCGMKVDN